MAPRGRYYSCSLVFVNEIHPTLKQRNRDWRRLVGPQSPMRLYLALPHHRGSTLFVLALVAISSPSTTNLCLRKAGFVPGHVHGSLFLLGRYIWPIWQILPLNKDLVDASPTWPQALKFCGGDMERCQLMPCLPKADIWLLFHMPSIIAYCLPATSISLL